MNYRKPHRLHPRAPPGRARGLRAVRHRPALHRAVDGRRLAGGHEGHPADAGGGRRRRLGRLGRRPGDRHPLRAVGPQRGGHRHRAVRASPLGHAARGRDAGPARGPQRAADLQAAVRPPRGHRPQEGRDPLVEGQRRRAARPPHAEGSRPATPRTAGARLAPRDEVARLSRRGRQRRRRGAAADLGRGRGEDVPRLRQADRRRGLGGGAARGHDGGADDLHGRRPAVHRGHRGLGGHAQRVRGAGPASIAASTRLGTMSTTVAATISHEAMAAGTPGRVTSVPPWV